MSIQVISSTDSEPTVSTEAGSSESNEETTAASTVETEETEETEESATLDVEGDDDDESDDPEQDDDETETPKDEKPKKKGGLEKRFKRFQRRLSEKDQEIEFLRRQVESRNTPDQNPETQNVGYGQDSERPVAEDFETHEEYFEALTDYKIEQREAAKVLKEREQKLQTAKQEQVGSFQSKVQEFKEANEDFEEVISDVDDIPLTLGFQEAILSSDIGPNVMYELAQNRAELERINALNPIQAAREIGKIEARISGALGTKILKPTTTKAPPPPNPVGSKSNGGRKKSIYDASLSQKEYERLREAQAANN